MGRGLIPAVLISLFSSLYGQLPCESEKPPSSDFDVVQLADGLSYPLQIDVAPGGDVFVVEKEGVLSIIESGSSSSRELLNLDVITHIQTGFGYGLVGVALDNNFSENGWLYLFYFPDADREPLLTGRVSRFTYDGSDIVSGSEKTLLEIPFNGFDHAGGSLHMDDKGNLWLSTGDDTQQVFSQAVPLNWGSGGGTGVSCLDNLDCSLDAARTAGNTNDLRGKILRITPLPFGDSEDPQPGVGTTYTLPEGNLFPQSDSARGEIYTMGHRNAYRYAVDEKTGWLFFGDPGGYPTSSMQNQYPDLPDGHDEYQIATQAGNMGWPYFAADNKPYAPIDFSNNTLSGDYFDPEVMPVNASPRNNGMLNIPLPSPAQIFFVAAGNNNYSHNFFSGKRICAPIGGPVYRYGNYGESTDRLPPWFDGKWFLTSNGAAYLAVATFDDNASVTGVEDSPLGNFAGNILDMEVGPDGALYFTTYGSVEKIIYTGDCLPVVAVESQTDPFVNSLTNQKLIRNKSLYIGSFSGTLRTYNLKGQLQWQYQTSGKNRDQWIDLPGQLQNKLMLLKTIPFRN